MKMFKLGRVMLSAYPLSPEALLLMENIFYNASEVDKRDVMLHAALITAIQFGMQ